ncbi:MAG: aminoacetone oxidase family FAD-binding enzyme [Kiritimatiellia bacterium]
MNRSGRKYSRKHAQFHTGTRYRRHQKNDRREFTHLPLAIIGGGAAGLFAGCMAGERGLPALILERKHKPGRKILMCGNGRCNFTKNISAEKMLADIGEPSAAFLESSLSAFPPSSIRQWFSQHRLDSRQMPDRRIFPKSEKASDVLHTLTDTLRDTSISLCLNTAVQKVEKTDHPAERFRIDTDNFTVFAQNVLLSTGGVSYPKTGSVGDGQKFAKALGHKLRPYRPGLIGFVIDHPWIRSRAGHILEDVTMRVFSNNRRVYEGSGFLDCESRGLGGAAAYNASRWIARHQPKNFDIEWSFQGETIHVTKPETRPLKEAIVTVGGIPLNEINPRTMESTRCSGLYFAGEIIDADGPTGGYNLSIAWATAKTAADAVSRSLIDNRQ